MSHEKLCEKAIDAIYELYADTSVDREITRADLQSLLWELQTLIDALE